MKDYLDRLMYMNRRMSNFLKVIIVFFIVYAVGKFGNKIINNPGILIKIILFMVAIILHEIAHGWAALISGDKTAKDMGRLTLNPIKHIDIAGILIPILLIFSGSNFIIGWAKPVPVNYYNFKNGRVGEFLVSIAGIATNFLLAFITTLIFKFFYVEILKFNMLE
ncbi:MAG: site-2 protease family protein, partial [Fusobacteriaceae bacterium]